MQYLGIIGAAPRPAAGPIQVDRFDRLERFIGLLEQAPSLQYPALHAAYHAFLNGVGRVIFAGVAHPNDPKAWEAALKRLFKSDPLPLVVAPGGPGDRLAAAFLALPFTARSGLWVDSGEAIPDRVWVADQQIPTTPPGRRTPTLLPASALLGPLHLGTATTLRGAHEAPDRPGWLVRNDRGRLALSRYLAPPGTRLPPPAPPEASGLHFRIDRALAAMVEPILLREPESPGLYKRLERQAGVILADFKRRGELVDYRVRCNAETSQDAVGPVIEVHIREPRRVEFVSLRFQRLGSS